MNADPKTGDVAGDLLDAAPWLRRLLTLPAHLANHSPEVALLLALWDLPEVRARVEAAT